MFKNADRQPLRLLGLICVFLVACGDGDNDDPLPSEKTSGGRIGEIQDTTSQGITAFLQAGTYKNWAADNLVHDSTGPHGKVRSFFNTTLVESLEAKNDTHPVGSISVKELYTADGSTLRGFALEAKSDEGTGGDTWLWYEGFTPAFDEYYGKGLATCTGCHSGGTDFVMSSPPS